MDAWRSNPDTIMDLAHLLRCQKYIPCVNISKEKYLITSVRVYISLTLEMCFYHMLLILI